MNNITETKRIIYSPSEFAKESLIYLQEVGQTKALKVHTSNRNSLDSYLFFIVIDGDGTLTYNKETISLKQGQCVFIDCANNYSHTSDNWTIKWIHFNGSNIKDIYNKYLSRNGNNVFESLNFDKYNQQIDKIIDLANSNSYTKDMEIYNSLINILTTIMSETIYEKRNVQTNIYNINEIKEYIDNNFLKTITLGILSNRFYINKFYLTRLFKQTYGITINNYINKKKIAKAKELLRFSDLTINEISIECNVNDTNYFIRLFKQLEGITPLNYRKKW